jgi:hypothetical protein
MSTWHLTVANQQLSWRTYIPGSVRAYPDDPQLVEHRPQFVLDCLDEVKIVSTFSILDDAGYKPPVRRVVMKKHHSAGQSPGFSEQGKPRLSLETVGYIRCADKVKTVVRIG